MPSQCLRASVVSEMLFVNLSGIQCQRMPFFSCCFQNFFIVLVFEYFYHIMYVVHFQPLFLLFFFLGYGNILRSSLMALLSMALKFQGVTLRNRCTYRVLSTMAAELEAEGWPVHRQMPEGRHNETLLLVWSWCPRLPDPTQLAHTPGLRHQLSHWFCELLTTFQ